MRILQIGAGSMGTRRLRDLQSRPGVALAVLDGRADRRGRARDRFGVETFADLEAAMNWGPTALIISTPPGTKGPYARLAVARGLHHFLEADFWCDRMAEIAAAARAQGIVSAPSTGLQGLPIVKGLAEAVRTRLGRLLGYQFCLSTYAPSWHPGEGVEYYARQRSTAPAREMVPFELNWLNPVFGPALEATGHCEKFGDLPDGAEDTWSLALRLRDGGLGQVTVTMACPLDYRRGCCFGTNAMIAWDVYSGDVVVHRTGEAAPRTANFGGVGGAVEAMYHAEIQGFVDALEGRSEWPHGHASNLFAAATLAAAEHGAATGTWVRVDPAMEIDPVPPARRPWIRPAA